MSQKPLTMPLRPDRWYWLCIDNDNSGRRVVSINGKVVKR
jgi:hypothetical protein